MQHQFNYRGRVVAFLWLALFLMNSGCSKANLPGSSQPSGAETADPLPNSPNLPSGAKHSLPQGSGWPIKKRPILKGLIGTSEVSLVRYRMRGDGNCGLHCLTFDRPLRIQQLRRDFVEKVRERYLGPEASPTAAAELRALLKEEIVGVMPKGLPPAADGSDLQQFVNEKLLDQGYYLEFFTNWFKNGIYPNNPDVMEGSLALAAIVFNRNIRVWKPIPGQPDQVELRAFFTPNTNENEKLVNLLHVNYNHFDLLVPEDDWEVRKTAGKREKEFNNI